MKRKLLLFMMLFTTLMGWSQNGSDPGDPGFLDQYAGFDFQGRFAAKVLSQEVNNFYLTDFSLLPSRFERIYFMNLSFSAEQIVNLRFEANRDIVCFKAHEKYPEAEIVKILDGLLEKTRSISSTWPTSQKDDWLMANDKYK